MNKKYSEIHENVRAQISDEDVWPNRRRQHSIGLKQKKSKSGIFLFRILSKFQDQNKNEIIESTQVWLPSFETYEITENRQKKNEIISKFLSREREQRQRTNSSGRIEGEAEQPFAFTGNDSEWKEQKRCPKMYRAQQVIR